MMLKLMQEAAKMRTTINLDDKLLATAEALTGIRERNTLVRLGIEALIAQESALRLMRLGGTDPFLENIPRRREPVA